MILPSVAEPNVCQRNASINEEYGNTRQGQKPGEDSSAIWRKIDVCQQSEEKLNNDNDERTTLLIDVCGDLGAHAYKTGTISRDTILVARHTYDLLQEPALCEWIQRCMRWRRS